jgi:hypothetical protein
MNREKETYTHPSYGMIRISRVHGGKQKFFGSELEVDHWIEIEILHGKMERELSNDWFYSSGRLPIASVRLSPIQFSELITNMNFGDGLPCTIQYINGEEIEAEKLYESKKESTHRQFKERMKSFASELVSTRDKAKDLVKKKTLSKEDQRQLLIHLDWMTQELTGNIPFFMQCFQEVADKVVAAAKAEVEAAITSKVTILGLEELKNQNKLLSDGK